MAGLQLAVGVTLARLLTPEAFGVVEMTLIAIGFAKLVGDLGFGAAVIQYPDLTTRHVHAVKRRYAGVDRDAADLQFGCIFTPRCFAAQHLRLATCSESS